MSPIGNILVTLLFTRILDMMSGGGMDSQKNWIILTASMQSALQPDAVLLCNSP